MLASPLCFQVFKWRSFGAWIEDGGDRMGQGDKPIKEFRAGSVRASIWQDQAVGENDETFNVFSVRVERRYKDSEGNWQSTTRFKRADLADLELVVFKAREFISLNERDPAKE